MGKVRTYGAALAELDGYLNTLTKSAAAKGVKLSAETSEESTSHPVEKADDQLAPATEGARSSENEADITSNVGPQNINDAALAADVEPKPVAMTTAKVTGDDPSNETAGAKQIKDDPGTSHPAEAGTEKGGSAQFLGKIKEACARFGTEQVVSELGNSIMADIAVMADVTSTEKAAEAGAAAADVAIARQVEAQLPSIVSGVVKQAEFDADNLAQFYTGFQKSAEGEPEEAISGEADAGIPGEAGEEGALPAEDLAQLAAVANDPSVAGATAGGAAGVQGEPGEDEVVQALSEALADAGVTPEELAAAVAAQESAGEAPVEEKMAAVRVAQQAASEVNRYRNLKSAGRIKTEKRASIQLVWSVRQMIKDVVGR